MLCQLGGNQLSTFLKGHGACVLVPFFWLFFDRENAMRKADEELRSFKLEGGRLQIAPAKSAGGLRLRVLWQNQFWGFPKRTDAGGPSPKLSSKLVAGDSLTRGKRVAVKKDTQILKITPICYRTGWET